MREEDESNIRGGWTDTVEAGVINENVLDICPQCLDKVLIWLDTQGADLAAELQNMDPEEEFMLPELKMVVHHFRFVATRIRALR